MISRSDISCPTAVFAQTTSGRRPPRTEQFYRHQITTVMSAAVRACAAIARDHSHRGFRVPKTCIKSAIPTHQAPSKLSAAWQTPSANSWLRMNVRRDPAVWVVYLSSPDRLRSAYGVVIPHPAAAFAQADLATCSSSLPRVIFLNQK